MMRETEQGPHSIETLIAQLRDYDPAWPMDEEGLIREAATALATLNRQHRYLVHEVASVARFLLDDSGFTRKHAAQSLAKSVRDRNAGSWTEEHLAVLLGTADRLPRVRNVHPADLALGPDHE